MTRTADASTELLATARSLYDQKKWKECLAAHRRLIELGTLADMGFYGIGLLDFNRNHLREAEIQFQNALKMNDKNANAHFYLGLISERRGQHKVAVDHYHLVTKLEPEHKAALRRLHYLQSKSTAAPMAWPKLRISAFAQSILQRVGIAFLALFVLFVCYSSSPGAVLALFQLRPFNYVRSPLQAGAFFAFLAALVLLGLWLVVNVRGIAARVGFLVVFVFAGIIIIAGPGPFRVILNLAVQKPLPFFLALIWILAAIVRVRGTSVSFDGYAFRISSSGFFKNSTKLVNVIQIRQVNIQQSFLNRLTADGQLVLSVQAPTGGLANVQLPGLADIRTLQSFQQSLEERLRQHASSKLTQRRKLSGTDKGHKHGT